MRDNTQEYTKATNSIRSERENLVPAFANVYP